MLQAEFKLANGQFASCFPVLTSDHLVMVRWIISVKNIPITSAANNITDWAA